MNTVVCCYCKSDDLTFDGSSDMYFCKKCSRLLGEDEVIREEQSQEPEEEHYYEVEEEEELTCLSILFLYVMMLVPVLNILAVSMICKSDVKNQYKKAFCYKFIVDVFVFMAVFVLVIFMIYNHKVDLSNSIHTIVNEVVSFVDGVSVSTIEVPELKSRDFLEILESQYQPVTDNNDKSDSLVSEWNYLDDAVIGGDKALDILERTGDNLVILIQTDEIADRYGKISYRNVGYLIEGSELPGTTGNYFYEGDVTLPLELYKNDYGEEVFLDTGDIYNKKYIYYLNPKDDYCIRVLRDADDSIIGFSFMEVSE